MPKQSLEKPKKGDALNALITHLEKITGVKGVLHKGIYEKPRMLSFGYQEVDEASNCGGIARGKLIEIFGHPSGGKSYLSLKLISSAQKEGLACCLVDAEQAFDPLWAKKHGVNIDDLYIFNESLPAEKILDIVVELCSSKEFGLVVVDSTAALVPEKELTGSVSDQDYALRARAMSKACPKIVSGCASTGTTCVFLNQIRQKMGVVFGNPETTPGGLSLGFFAHQRILVTPGSIIRIKDGKKGDDNKEEKGTPVGRKSYVKFVKNKTASPFGECVIEIIFNEAAMNPVVMLCNSARNYKLIGNRKGQFQIKKDVINTDKNLDTGISTTTELADYLIKNNLVQTLIDAYIKAVEEDDEGGEIAPEIMLMKEDPSTIKSPMEGIDVEVISNKSQEVVDENSEDIVENDK